MPQGIMAQAGSTVLQTAAQIGSDSKLARNYTFLLLPAQRNRRDKSLFSSAEGAAFFFSTDYGTSWTPAYSGLENYGTMSLLSVLTGLISLQETYGGGVFFTNNGTSWTATGLTNRRVIL